MTYPKTVQDVGLELSPYLSGSGGRMQLKGQVDSQGRKQLVLKAFGKVRVTYTWAEKEQAYLID